MQGTVREILNIIQPARYDRKLLDARFDGVSIDTRTLKPGELYIALSGENFDGDSFAPLALELGAACVVVSKRKQGLDDKYIMVKDTAKALRNLATYHRSNFDMPLIAISGSIGKSTVSKMCHLILQGKYDLHITKDNRCNLIGVPLTLLELDKKHQLSIVEVAVSQPGDMPQMKQMVQPTMGVLTNITAMHLGNFGNIKKSINERRLLFDDFREDQEIILPFKGDYIRQFCKGLRCKTITFGSEDGADYQARDIVITDGLWLQFTVEAPGGESARFRLPIPARYMTNNALAAVALCHRLGVNLSEAAQALQRFETLPMRIEIHTSDFEFRNLTIINDTYNANLVSMKAALDTLVELAESRRKIAVLGDMLELGDMAVSQHRELGDYINKLRIDKLFLVGEQISLTGSRIAAIAPHKEKDIYYAKDQREAAELLFEELKDNDVVLFKGSRRMRLERVAQQYMSGIRQTRLIIDLDAIRSNIRNIRKAVGDKVKIMTIVKGFGYGHDESKIARTLLDASVDYLAVAIPDEGIKLRRSEIKAPILVLGPTSPEEAHKLIDFDLAQMVCTLQLAQALHLEAKRENKKAKVHIKVDTGMGRIGLSPKEVLPFLQSLERLDCLELEGIMTHFSVADDPTGRDYTNKQLADFIDLLDELKRHGYSFELRHAANSAAAIAYPESRLNMVRIGIALYGYYPNKALASMIKLTPAMTLLTRIAYLKTVPPGTSISYGRTFKTERETKIATIPIGYNDGYPRALSNKGEVLVRGKRAPVIGNVCMDMTIIDVTDIPGVSLDDEVVLFGYAGDTHLPVEELSDKAGTINYEIISRISHRVPRVYIDGYWKKQDEAQKKAQHI